MRIEIRTLGIRLSCVYSCHLSSSNEFFESVEAGARLLGLSGESIFEGKVSNLI